MVDPRDDAHPFAAGTDWPAFVADLDPDVVRRFNHVICALPPVISPGAVIDRVDALIAGADVAYSRKGYPGWNAYVADVRELAVLRERLREWFFERGYRDDARVAAHLGSLMLDSRTRFADAPVADAGIQPPPLAGRMEAIVAAAPYLILIIVMLATLCLAMMMTFKDVIGWRNAAAGIALAMAVTMLSMGAIVGTVRQRRRPAPPLPGVTATPKVPYAAHGMLVTRDSVCMADDIDAPHAARIGIDPDADALGVADAILAAGYLPAVAGTSTWSIRLGEAPDADAAVFGHYSGGSFGHRVDGGTATLRSTGVARVELRYHGQQRPDDVIGQLALTRRDAMDAAGQSA